MTIFSKTKYLNLSLLILFIIDRISKYLIFHKLPTQGVYLFKYLQIKLLTNSGIAFGIPLNQILIIILNSIIIFFLFFYLFKSLKEKKTLNAFLLGAIIIGAFSNLIDRITYGKVIDFIQIGIWPTFNLADAYISIGALIFLILNIKKTS
jgi:signal peptidase II